MSNKRNDKTGLLHTYAKREALAAMYVARATSAEERKNALAWQSLWTKKAMKEMVNT